MKKYIFTIIAGFGGGVVGYFYYYFIGCKTGSCALSSNPFLSILWGSAFGIILFFPSKKKK